MSNIADKVYTPDFIVNEVLDVLKPHINITDTIIEPFKGGGAFFHRLQQHTIRGVDWCEIDLDRDFFKCNQHYDWLITNPPYSIFPLALQHSLQCSTNTVFVIPVGKIFTSLPRLRDIKLSGSAIRQIHYLGSGRQMGFPFGFPVAMVWMQKGWFGGITETYADRCLK